MFDTCSRSEAARQSREWNSWLGGGILGSEAMLVRREALRRISPIVLAISQNLGIFRLLVILETNLAICSDQSKFAACSVDNPDVINLQTHLKCYVER